MQRADPAEAGFLKFAAGCKQLVAELGFQFILTVGKGFGEGEQANIFEKPNQ